jgi:hypothetical protein
MLHHLAALPPTLALEVLQTVLERVLNGVPAPAPRLQAEPFGDSALAQVCTSQHVSGVTHERSIWVVCLPPG